MYKLVPGLAIIEIKTNHISNNNAIIQWLKYNRIHETSFSKYNIGVALLNPEIKQNNFKPIILNLHKHASNISNY